MMSKFLRIVFASLVLISLTSVDAQAQREKGKTAKEQMKEQKKMQEDRKQKVREELKSKREHQLEIQDKKTRKRMKRTRRKSERYSQGKRLPFYKRWFRKKKFK